MIQIKEKATQARFGDLVGVSRRTVSDLSARGVLKAGGTYGEWLRSYTAHLREIAAGRASASGDEDYDLTKERARLARIQADKTELELQIKRAEVAPTEHVEAAFSQVGSKIASILDAVPASVKRQAPNLTATDIEVMKREIAKAQNAAAGMEYEPGD